MVALTGAGAYAAMQSQVEKAMSGASGTSGVSGGSPVQGGGFGEMVQNVIADAMNQSKTAEIAMTNQVQGKAELIDVVTAISSAEASLETMIAVRDQVISAYQEIMRMPI